MDIYTLTNGNGLTARITDFGARIVSLLVPNRNGNLCDIVLGFDNLDDYLPQNHLSDFGALIGRYANRIGNGRFTLDGQTYQLPQNNGPHCLHGGPTGWQYARFQLVECSPRSLTLQFFSPDGDNGFPGNVRVQVVYTLGDDNSLDISYHAVTDAPTVINITNHSYFNLSGDPNRDILDHILTINADRYTPIDNTSIPLGPLECVEGTPLDFRSPSWSMAPAMTITMSSMPVVTFQSPQPVLKAPHRVSLWTSSPPSRVSSCTPVISLTAQWWANGA